MAVDRLGRPLRDDPYRGNVRVYSASNITLSGLQTIDGVTLESGDRVLCNGQTTTSQNGIYVATTGVWSRSRDLSTSDDFTGPIIVTVEEGTTYRNTFWHMLPASTITVGTDAISFTSGYPTAQFGNGDALSVFGRASNSSGARDDIAAGTDGHILRRSGTTLGFGNASGANVDYDQGGTNSVATTVQTRLRLMEVCPEDFGCVGDGSTDDSTNFTRFISALKVVSAARGAVLGRLRGVYAISSQQTLSSWSGQITLIADAGAGIKTTGSGSYTGLYVAGGGATGSTFTISGSPSYGAETITLSAVTGLSVGDYCEIENATGYSSDVRFMRNRIRAISGNDVTLDLPLAFDINSSNTTRFQEVSLQSGFKCEGLNAVHTGSGQVNGLSFFNLLEPQIINTRTADYNSTNSQGFVTYGIYGGLIDGVYDTNSGQSSNSDAIVLGCTNTDILNIRSFRAAGFGIGATYCASNRMVNLTSLRAVGRGLKMFGCCDNSITNVRVDGSGSSFTGFAISGGSSYNRVHNVVARRNGTGLWLNGTGNINNYFNNVELVGNTTDLTVATTSPLDDTGNIIDNLSTRATTFNLSSTAVPIIRFSDRAQGVSVASATTTDIGAAASEVVTITGTTTITGLGTVKSGTRRWVRFSGALTLTHNATSLILPGGANITTAAGDTMLAVSEGSGNWRVYHYQPAAGDVGKAGTQFMGGPLIVGHTAQVSVGASNTTTPESQFHGTLGVTGNFRWTNAAGGPQIALFKSRGTAIGTRGVVQSGDTLGSLSFYGDDGTNGPPGGVVRVVVDGTPGAGDMPGRIEFLTTPDGSSVSSIRLTIAQDGLATFAAPVKVPSYTVAGVPSASGSGAGAMIYVTNETGGAVLAFSDGTNWRRVTDRAIVS